jgi:hypothetical protein
MPGGPLDPIAVEFPSRSLRPATGTRMSGEWPRVKRFRSLSTTIVVDRNLKMVESLSTMDVDPLHAGTCGMLPSPRQIAAARVLLGLSRAELAAKAGLHVNALKRLEQGVTNPRRTTLEAVMRALDADGIEFLSETADRGEGIIRRKSRGEI